MGSESKTAFCVFRSVREVAKGDRRLPSCLSAWINSAPIGRIFVKFNI